MRRASTIAVSIALLVASFQASYSHLHLDLTSDHAREHHLAQGLSLHTHFDAAPGDSADLPAVGSLPSHEREDVLFLAWAPEAPQFDFFPIALPVEAKVLKPPDRVARFVLLPARHSHDPPFVFSAAPRSPPGPPA